jgi:formylglycine-generating enzyme required for sulfatase activity
MARYPVSNAQYSLFVAAGGYGHERYWPEARQAGFWRPGWFRGRWDESWRSGPVEFSDPFGLPNHPVVGVTWYEALAFTRWLNGYLHGKGLLTLDWAIRLPSEAEWEKAARGGWQVPAEPVFRCPALGLQTASSLIKNPDDKRVYPWPGTIDLDRVNYGATGIGSTSAVGCFPGGASPCGAEEMSGNVWEWTRSVYEQYPYPVEGKALQQREDLAAGDSHSRVLRGGLFFNVVNYLRCAARLWYLPMLRSDNIGFRVCASPLRSVPEG